MFEILIILFLVLAFVLAVWVFFAQGRRKKIGQKELKYIHSHWNRVIQIHQINPKEAIMDADKLLDYTLKSRGYQGSLGEKLKKAGPLFSDENGVWFAHKLRNRVAHELGDIRYAEVKSALKSFKRALNDLGANL